MDNTIIPVLVGADLNCYNIARAFHERYGVKSYVFARYSLSAIKYSKIIRFHAVPNMNEDVLVRTLQDFADRHRGAKLVLFGCTDDYATAIARVRNRLPDYTIPYPEHRLQPMMLEKSSFYELCERYNIPYPATFLLHEAAPAATLSEAILGFPYPIILKPASSIEYWRHPFPGMQKVYRADTPAEAAQIAGKIFGSGYTKPLILQETIGGGDTNMRVLTTFSDKRGKVRAVCLGHTLLEEHTPKGLGNHAAIITEPAAKFPLTGRIIHMLEDVGYTGFANFDIKQNGDRPDDFRVFEINMRQGRSNYYLTAAGLNVAALAAETFDDAGEDVMLCDKEIFWHAIPASLVYRYTEDKALVEKARELVASGSRHTALWYGYDLRANPLRLLYVLEHLRRQYGKYRRYYPRPGQSGKAASEKEISVLKN